MRAAALSLSAILALGGVASAGEGPGTLANATFSEWGGDGLPVGWGVEEGAAQGAMAPASAVSMADGGGVALSGDASTRSWRLLRQRVDGPVDGGWRLRFEARLDGARVDAGQFDNAYVGLSLPVERGERGARLEIETEFRPEWTPCEVLAPADRGAVDVVVFLSKTGRLSVRALRLEWLPPARSYDVLVEHMARRYSFLHAKGLDWAAFAATHRDAFPADGDSTKFLEAFAAFARDLGDLHVHASISGRRVGFERPPPPRDGFEARVVASRLADVRQHGRTGFVGRFEGDVLYAALGSLMDDRATFERFLADLDGALPKARAFVLDLRPCVGGDETRGTALASRFATAPTVYARRSLRNGPASTDFAAPAEVRLVPGPAAGRFGGRVVVLVGPRCVSSGEGTAMMFRAVEGATLVGLPTAGASGNPRPARLPNGVEVWFSRWVNELPDGTPTEGKGIPPHVRVEVGAEGDPILDRGLVEARKPAR